MFTCTILCGCTSTRWQLTGVPRHNVLGLYGTLRRYRLGQARLQRGCWGRWVHKLQCCARVELVMSLAFERARRQFLHGVFPEARSVSPPRSPSPCCKGINQNGAGSPVVTPVSRWMRGGVTLPDMPDEWWLIVTSRRRAATIPQRDQLRPPQLAAHTLSHTRTWVGQAVDASEIPTESSNKMAEVTLVHLSPPSCRSRSCSGLIML